MLIGSDSQRSMVGCRPWGRTESDTTEATEQQQQQKSLLTFAAVTSNTYPVLGTATVRLHNKASLYVNDIQ